MRLNHLLSLGGLHTDLVMNYPAASYGVSEGIFALQISDLQTSGCKRSKLSGNLTPRD